MILHTIIAFYNSIYFFMLSSSRTASDGSGAFIFQTIFAHFLGRNRSVLSCALVANKNMFITTNKPNDRIQTRLYSLFCFLASTHYTLHSLHFSYILLALSHHILNHEGTHYTSQLHLTITRHINEQQNNRINVVTEREVPFIGKTNRPHFRLLQVRQRLPHCEHFASDSSGIQHIEQIVAQEQQPCRHRQTQKLHKVEHVARYFHKRPAILDLICSEST